MITKKEYNEIIINLWEIARINGGLGGFSETEKILKKYTEGTSDEVMMDACPPGDKEEEIKGTYQFLCDECGEDQISVDSILISILKDTGYRIVKKDICLKCLREKLK